MSDTVTTPPRAIVRALIALGVALVLGTVGFLVATKERIKRDGEIVYLELAPVDPRSLIQGDYMALRFAIVTEMARRDPPGGKALPEGTVTRTAVTLDERRVAHLAPADNPAAPLRLRYRIRGGAIWLGTNAFFFEEGTAQRYEAARYGEFRVDRTSGEAVLVGLRDAKLEPL